jgi:hypothetical protein
VRPLSGLVAECQSDGLANGRSLFPRRARRGALSSPRKFAPRPED